MNKVSYLAIGLSLVALLVAVFAGQNQPQQLLPIGATPGNEVLVPMFFRDTITVGGFVNATSSSIAAVTYLARDFAQNSLIIHTASAAVTATMPASSTLASMITKPGDWRTVYLAPVTNNVTLAGGTGTDVNTASSTKVCLQATVCRLDFVRKSNFDIEVLLTGPSGN